MLWPVKKQIITPTLKINISPVQLVDLYSLQLSLNIPDKAQTGNTLIRHDLKILPYFTG